MSVIIGKVGLSTNLDSAPIENGFKYTVDTGVLYLDYGSGDSAKRVRVSTPVIPIDQNTTFTNIYNTLMGMDTGPIVVIGNLSIDANGDNLDDTLIHGLGTISLDKTDYVSVNFSIQCGDWIFRETLAITQSDGGTDTPDTSDEKWQHTLAEATTKFRISDFASQIATATAFSTKYATMLDIIGNHK